MDKVICFVCGSDDLKKETSKEVEQLTLGPEFNYEQVVYTCNACGEQGDFERINDSKFLEAQKSAQVISVKSLVESLSEKDGISMAFFERAFELPIRTVTRWKNGDFSATTIAFLRTIKTYPWIAEVAASRFEPQVAKKVLLREGFSLVREAINATEGSSVHFSVEQDHSAISATAVLTVNKSTQAKPRLVAVGG